MTEVKPSEDIVINRRRLATGVLIALAVLLMGGTAFAVGVHYSQVNPNNPFSFHGRSRAIGPMFGGRFGSRGMFVRHATYGTIKSLGTNQFDLTTNTGTALTVTVDNNTGIFNQGTAISFSDLKLGEQVVVFGTVNGTQVTATRVISNPSSSTSTPSL